MAANPKPFATIDSQIATLKKRGMKISDEAKAKHALQRIGYYRLSAYWYPCRKTEKTQPVSASTTAANIQDDYKPGSSFSSVIEFYVFDKKLRIIVMDALERIEIAVRAEIANHLGSHDPTAHRKTSFLDGNFAKKPAKKGHSKTRHQIWLEKLDNKFSRSREAYAEHFRNKNPGANPPIWISIENWDFGTLSTFYSGMKHADKLHIASIYGLSSPKVFESWLRCLNDVRNICAHHSRLWNKPLVSQPSWPSQSDCPEIAHIIGDTHAQTRVYAALLISNYLLNHINPTSSWHRRLQNHLKSLPSGVFVTTKSAGFPTNWEAQSIWENKLRLSMLEKIKFHISKIF